MTFFVSLDNLGKSKWDKYEDMIREAFVELDGVYGIAAVTGLCRTHARRLAIRYNLIKGANDREYTSDRISERLKKNLEHLRMVWGWVPGQEEIVLTRMHRYIAQKACRCGGVWCRPGQSYTQYGIPTGKVLKYMKENGLKYFVGGETRVPVDLVKNKGLLSIKDKVDC